MRENFNISKDGIQIPYGRFLSDSAAGLAFLLILAMYYHVPLFTEQSLRQIIASFQHSPEPLGSELKVLLIVLSFLLATPVGFAISALSWLLLGQVVSALEGCCFRLSRQTNVTFFPVWDVSDSRLTPFLVGIFGMSAKTLTPTTSLLRQALKSTPLADFVPEMQYRNLVEFLRNAAFLALLGAAIALFSFSFGAAYQVAFWSFVASAFLVLSTRVPHRNTLFKVGHWSAILAVILGGIFLLAHANHALRVRAVSLLVASIVLLFTAGSVAFYDCCALLLHAYFARVGVEGQIPDVMPESKPAQIVTSMVDRAATIARSAASKPS